MALAACEFPEPEAPVTYGLSKAELAQLHADAYRERMDLEPDVEIWLADEEGAWLSEERERLFRASDEGVEISKVTTLGLWTSLWRQN